MVSYVSDKVSTTIAIAVLLLVGNTSGVFARIVAKRRAGRRLKADDYWMFAALLMFYPWVILAIYIIVRTAQSNLSLQLHMVLMMVLRVLYLFDITAIKVSILLFYLGIFDSLRWFQLSAWAVAVLCVIWSIAGLVPAAILNFLPGCTFFRLDTPGQNTVCTQSSSFLLAHVWLNPALDVVILLLPVVVIPQLHLPLRQKFQALAVFLMGSFVVVASIVGIVLTVVKVDIKQGIGVDVGFLWRAIELGIAMLCGNMPTYRPLLRDLITVRNRISTFFSTTSTNLTLCIRSRTILSHEKQVDELQIS